MMKIFEIECCIPIAVEMFKDKFPDAEIPEITVLKASKITKEREQIYKECGDNGLVECDSLYGEFVHGSLGSRIIIYQNMFDNPFDVLKALWHELGHVLFGSKEKYGIDCNASPETHRGHFLFGEFIAEYIVYVLGGYLLPEERNPNEYLCMAFQDEETVVPYWLCRYMSIVLGDTSASEKFVSQSCMYVPDEEVWDSIDSMLELLKEQLDSNEFWKPSTEVIEELGGLYMDILLHLSIENKKLISSGLPV